MGTPIVAPFDGAASASPSVLGGNAVTVRGSHGFVSNAHLVAYGKLGPVGTGDVVGYVGGVPAGLVCTDRNVCATRASIRA